MNVAHPLAAVRAVPRRRWLRYRFVFLVLAPVMALFIFLRIVPTGQAILIRRIFRVKDFWPCSKGCGTLTSAGSSGET